jgi:mRNA-degrading endonuclease RelE of RelBE toxin-antitoxin system
MQVTVLLSPEAQGEFDALPPTIRARVLRVFERLRDWPRISGAKPLSGDWAGHFRIRTGDWRVIVRVVTPAIIVVRIKHRSEVYED